MNWYKTKLKLLIWMYTCTRSQAYTRPLTHKNTHLRAFVHVKIEEWDKVKWKLTKTKIDQIRFTTLSLSLTQIYII